MNPTKVSDAIKKYGGVLSKGLLIEMAPQVAKGAIAEVLRAKGTNVKKVTEWVQGNTCLWDNLEPGHQKLLLRLRESISSLDWLTADFIIDAIRRDLPAVASLFLGWKKANNWLKRQVVIIKERIEQQSDLTKTA